VLGGRDIAYFACLVCLAPLAYLAYFTRWCYNADRHCQYMHCIGSCSCTCSPREGIIYMYKVGFHIVLDHVWTRQRAMQIHGVNNGPYSTLADKTAVYAIAVDSPSRAGSHLHELTHMPRAFRMENFFTCLQGFGFSKDSGKEGPKTSDRPVDFRSGTGQQHYITHRNNYGTMITRKPCPPHDNHSCKTRIAGGDWTKP
jgi:hypothetical protein